MNQTPFPTADRDSDGIPPGLDLSMVNREGMMVFTGVFFACRSRGPIEIRRPVTIIWASKEIFVAFDKQHQNLYVIDRVKNYSIACQMNAIFVPNS